MAFARDRATGFLGLHMREPASGELWADAAMITLASGVSPERTLVSLLRAALPVLRTQWVAGIICLTVESWLHDALIAAGFVETDEVITYTRSNQLPVPRAEPIAALRTAGPAEADAVLALNAAAFRPFWRYDSATTLSWLFTADHAVLAEREGRPLGFALTDHTQGIGRQLVVDAIAFSRLAGSPGLALNTQASNAVSRHLYEALDFRVLGAPVRVMVYSLK
jgi:ribosomal protein S18 acetylase RimI-like enzyme